MPIPVLKLKSASTNTNLPYLANDPFLAGDNGGVKFLYDFSNTDSWPGGNPSATNFTASNLPTNSVGSAVLTSPSTGYSFSGNGIDFSAAPINRILQSPQSAFADASLQTNQNWLFMAYFKLPTSANWNTGGAIYTMSLLGNGAYNIANTPVLFMLAQATGGTLQARVQFGSTGQTTVGFVLTANEYGQVAQVGISRGAGANGAITLSVRTALNGAPLTATGTSGGLNTNTLANINVGAIAGSFQPFAGHNAAYNSYKLYRAAFEDLSISGRTPATVLAADWTRIAAANRFS